MIEGYRVYVSFRGVYWEFSRSLIRKSGVYLHESSAMV